MDIEDFPNSNFINKSSELEPDSSKNKNNFKREKLINQNKQKCNLIKNKIKHVKNMQNIEVYFPYEMYPSQEKFISNAIGRL
jgi:hypothetical protein